MKKLFRSIRSKVNALCDKVSALCTKVRILCRSGSAVLASNRGDLSTNTIGAIIVAVVIIGLLIVAVNAFFPTFFSDMLNSMKTKLNGHW